MKEYADRDPMALEPFFSRHMAAMTAERLESKADIACELAQRDAEIESLCRKLAESNANNERIGAYMRTLEHRLDEARSGLAWSKERMRLATEVRAMIESEDLAGWGKEHDRFILDAIGEHEANHSAGSLRELTPEEMVAALVDAGMDMMEDGASLYRLSYPATVDGAEMPTAWCISLVRAIERQMRLQSMPQVAGATDGGNVVALKARRNAKAEEGS